LVPRFADNLLQSLPGVVPLSPKLHARPVAQLQRIQALRLEKVLATLDRIFRVAQHVVEGVVKDAGFVLFEDFHEVDLSVDGGAGKEIYEFWWADASNKEGG